MSLTRTRTYTGMKQNEVMRSCARILAGLFICVSLISCRRQGPAPSGRHASIIMRDGTLYSGIVTSSSGDQLTLAGDDRRTYTLAMKDVKSLQYDDTTTQAQATSPSGPPVASPTPPPAEQPAPVENAPPPQYHPRESEIEARTFVVPPGTEIPVRTDETIDSRTASDGQTWAARITRDIRDRGGRVVIPRGSNALVVIRSASRGGAFHGAADLVLGLGSVSVEGRRYRLISSDIDERGRGAGANRRTAEYAGGGGVFGAIVGALAGGGKGAAIGALSGAGAGAAAGIMTKGHAIRVPAETLLIFRLERPLHVTAG